MSHYSESERDSTNQEEKKSSGSWAILVFILFIAIAAGGGTGGKAIFKSANVSAASSGEANSGIEQQIRNTFGIYGDEAVTVAKCESSMNPQAYNTMPVPDGEHAMGLFQIIPSTFHSVSSGNVYNVTDNINAAHAIFVRDGNSWQEWACKPY